MPKVDQEVPKGGGRVGAHSNQILESQVGLHIAFICGNPFVVVVFPRCLKRCEVEGETAGLVPEGGKKTLCAMLPLKHWDMNT